MNVLLAVDRSEASDKAVRFVGRQFGRAPGGDFHITVFHVAEAPPHFITSHSQEDADGAFRKVAENWDAAQRNEGGALLARIKQQLVGAGISSGAVDTKLEVRQSAPESAKVFDAIAIIEEMKRGPYDVIVLGRRASSAMGLTLVGGVTEKVLREAEGRTVWIVD